MTILCPHCGTNNRIGSNFCNNCGTDLRDGEQTSPTLAEEQVEHQDGEPASTTPESQAIDEEMSDVVDEQGDEKIPRPLFDLGLASAEQPWLGPQRAGSEAFTADPSIEDKGSRSPAAGSQRLVTGVQGSLDPLNIRSGQQAQPSSLPSQPVTGPSLTAEESERIRRVMGEAPIPAMQRRDAVPSRFPRLRIPWLFWVIGLAVALPVFGFLTGPGGETVTWPGVNAAYATVDALPAGTHVFVYFAYDPATSGEMDLVAVPALRHLLDRRSNLTFITLNPNGPATVRRTVRLALDGRLAESEMEVALRRITARNVYLSGGATVLPLAGAAPDRLPGPTAAGRTPPLPAPALTVLFAPSTEDVQHWLELVQPLDGTPAVAYTGAGVDPMARPYLDNGQLQGLVSGFDGAAAYAALLDDASPVDARLQVQTVAQNWGHVALLFVLLMGNVAGYLGRHRNGT